MYASEAKKFEFLINLDHFSKFLKLGYSQIKIDRIAVLLKLQIKIGVHLINVALKVELL